MRVLQITRNFPPLRGGMERLNARMFEALRAQDETCALLGPAGSTRFVAEGTRISELPAKPLPATILASVVRGIAMARAFRPDVVLAGSGLTAPAAVMAARACGARSAVYLHGLDIIAPSRLYRALWLPCIRRCHRVIVNSANTRRLAIEAGVDANRVAIVHPGTDLPALDPGARARFRERHGIDAATPILLSVGRMTARKGLAEFVANALPAIVTAQPQARLLIVGDNAPDALHRGAGAGFERVRAVAEAAGVAEAVRWLGPCSDAELAEAYAGADVHVFPVRDVPGDVEGFGMVAIEAAAYGLPTVAFAVGGVPDAVRDGESGYLLESEDYCGFANRVLCLLGSEDDMAVRIAARKMAVEFSWNLFGIRLNDLIACTGRRD